MTDGHALIRFVLNGQIHEWGIGCDADEDNDVTLEAHLTRWRPGAVYLGACIRRFKNDVVISDTRADDAERPTRRIELE